MTSMQLFQGFSGVDAELLASVEQPPVRERAPAGKRIWLIAAVVALAALLVGCAAYYVLSMERVKIGESAGQRDYTLVDGVYEKDPHTVSTSILTLSGLEGSNAYKACADYYAFQEEYDRNMEQMIEAGTLPEDFWDTYADTMDAKAAKLAEQYHLKPTGNLLSFRTTRNLCDALGVERFTQTGQALRAEINGGSCYDSGNFWLDMGFTFPEDQGYEVVYTPGVLRWNRLDSFSRDYVTLVDSGDWVERNYTTASGSTVLILQSPSQELGYILCDRGEALMSLQLNVNIELLSEDGGVVSAEYQHMTDEQINMVADSIDFTVQPKLPTQADVDAQPEISQEATQDGYTVQLKSVETDGYVVRILLGITAPEGTALPDVEFSNWYSALTPTSGAVSGGDSTNGIIDDGDGKDNTADWLLIDSPIMADGSMPFIPGSTWELHLVDIVHSGWDSVNNRSYNDTLAEGEWLFSIHFDEQNGDYRELELLSQPVSAQASTCWRMDGTDVTDVLETFRVTSVKVRRMSIQLTSNAGENADFFHFYGASSYAVMRDGSRVEIMNSEFVEPIDLEKLDYILLADGTRLPVPGN